MMGSTTKRGPDSMIPPPSIFRVDGPDGERNHDIESVKSGSGPGGQYVWS